MICTGGLLGPGRGSLPWSMMDLMRSRMEALHAGGEQRQDQAEIHPRAGDVVGEENRVQRRNF